MALTFFSILGALLNPAAHAEKFANQFLEFEKPPQWQCALEGAEWVCQSESSLKKKDAIIILAAKLKGDQDSLDQYLSYLKQPKNYTSLSGKVVKSDAKYAKTIQIADHVWVDSLHLESEIPGFYTRYLATVKKDIAVLVTYSINKNKYKENLEVFTNMVSSLKVFRKAGPINSAPTDKPLFDRAQIPSRISQDTIFGQNIPQVPPSATTQNAGSKSGMDDFDFYLIVAGIAIAALIIWKKLRRRL